MDKDHRGRENQAKRVQRIVSRIERFPKLHRTPPTVHPLSRRSLSHGLLAVRGRLVQTKAGNIILADRCSLLAARVIGGRRPACPAVPAARSAKGGDSGNQFVADRLRILHPKRAEMVMLQQISVSRYRTERPLNVLRKLLGV